MSSSNFLLQLQEKSSNRREELLLRLRSNPQGFEWCQQHSQLADDIWRDIHREMVKKFPECSPIAIVATGGYGRQELSPGSDIDVSLVPLKEEKGLEEALRWVFRAADQVIRSGLGLRLSYTYRLPADIPGLDPVTISNLLDLRLIAGSPEPSRRLEEVLVENLPDAEFILQKLEERQRDMANSNETPFVVEPNLKLGAGGLRCFHTSNWIGIALGERNRHMNPQVDKILTARNLLHLVSSRQQDVLNRARREEIAEILGTEPNDFGSQLADSLSANHSDYLAGLRRIHENRFDIGKIAKSVRGELRIDNGSPADQAGIAVDIATRLGLIIPENISAITEESSPEALTALTCEETIRNLHKSGVLNRLIPPLAACTSLMPGDASHKYTVYEHTLQAVRLWDRIDTHPSLGEIRYQIKESDCMMLAILLHDVGKAVTGRPHSESGEEIAAHLCRTWKLDFGRADLVTWLVKEHLTMSKFIRMRDVMHPDTANEFASIVQDEQRLAMLTILTYCDVNAVNNELWTPMQEQFLLELYSRTLSIVKSSSIEIHDESFVKRRMLRHLKNSEFPESELAKFLDSLPTHYLLSTDSDSAAIHFEYAKQAHAGQITVSFDDQPQLGITDITVAAPDTPGALTAILGVLYAYDLTLVGLRASTTNDATPILLDTFTVTSSKQSIPSRIASLVSQGIRSVLTGHDVDEILAKRGKNPARKQEFLKINIIDQEPYIIEIQAPKGRGLAYRLARVIADQKLNIVAARVGQWAASGSAAFYVQPQYGDTIDAEEIKAAFAQNPSDG